MALGSPAVVLRQGPRGDELAWCRRPLHPAPIAMARRRRTSPARTISTICSTVKPWAIISPAAGRARRLASNSSRSSAAAQGACAGGLAIVSCVPDDGVQNEPLVMYPCGQLPPGPGGFGTGSGSVSAAVVTSASTGKGRFYWVDLCLGHYWDTAAVRC